MFYSVIEHIDAIASDTPQRSAIMDESISLTYHELVQHSYYICEQLERAGIARQTRIGISMGRSAVLIASMLGVLRHGCSYVPLDPTLPKSRTGYIVQNAELKYVLVQSISTELPAPTQQIVVSLSNPLKEVPSPTSTKNPHNIQPENELYIIFTSGTTGQPKGVKVTHLNLMRLLQVAAPLFEFKESDRWCLFHSACFDFSVWEIFGALYNRASLYIVPDRIVRETGAFREFLIKSRITILNQTPSAFYQLSSLESVALQSQSIPAPHGLHSLRYVIFGGESLSLTKLKDWLNLHTLNEVKLVNMYGITEITVHATFKELSPLDFQQPMISNIGRPLPDLDILLIDENGKLVENDAEGEMVIVGAGVSQGYHNNRALTAERFYWHQNSDSTRQYAYRSGDLAKRLANGEFAYLGRKDKQVKIRGYRIELGEIEFALSTLPNVHQCLAMVREFGPGDNRIVAFVVPHTNISNIEFNTENALRQISNLIPDYMLPSVIHCINEIPLTVNKKVDLEKLNFWLDQESMSAQIDTDFENEIESELYGIWIKVLKTKEIRRNTQFHQAGGDSLLTVLLLLEIQTRWGVTIKLRQLEDDFSIASLAQIVQR